MQAYPDSCIKYSPEDSNHYDLDHAIDKRYFGGSLNDCIMGAYGIPLVIERCVEEIRQHGMFTEGIFRRSGKMSKLKLMMDRFNHETEITFEEFDDIHLWSSLLKMYLRDLQEPLLTFALFEDVMRLADVSDSDEHLAIVQQLFKEPVFPGINLVSLYFLINFLGDVARESESNCMTIENIAIVVGPSLLWSRTEPANLFTVTKVNHFVQYLITHCKDIFHGRNLETIQAQEREASPNVHHAQGDLINGDYSQMGLEKSLKQVPVTTSNIKLLNMRESPGATGSSKGSKASLVKGYSEKGSNLSVDQILSRSGKKSWAEVREDSPATRRKAKQLKDALPGKPVEVSIKTPNDLLFRNVLRPGYKSVSDLPERKHRAKQANKKNEKKSGSKHKKGSNESLKEYSKYVNESIEKEKGEQDKDLNVYSTGDGVGGHHTFDIDWSASGDILLVQGDAAKGHSANGSDSSLGSTVGYTEFVSQKHRKLFNGRQSASK